MVNTYLQYSTFDADSNLVAQQQAPLPQDAQGNWEYLELSTTADSAGYMDVQTVNDSPEDVYFDDFEVIQYRNLVIQEQHYYPIGQRMYRLDYKYSSSPQSKFQFSGKERISALGLELYDFGARAYDTQLGRWHGVDPLAHWYYSHSPCNYTLNSPVNFTDPDGRSVDGHYYEKEVNLDIVEKRDGPDRFFQEGRNGEEGYTEISRSDLASGMQSDYADAKQDIADGKIASNDLNYINLEAGRSTRFASGAGGATKGVVGIFNQGFMQSGFFI